MTVVLTTTREKHGAKGMVGMGYVESEDLGKLSCNEGVLTIVIKRTEFKESENSPKDKLLSNNSPA